MQVNAINSVNFKGFQDENFGDIERAINAAKTLENISKRDSFENSNEGNKPKKKNFFQTAVSVAGSAVAAFLLTRKMYSKAMPAITGFFTKNKGSIESLFKKLPQKVQNIKNAKLVNSVKTVSENIEQFVNDNFVEKIGGKANAVGALGAIAGTTCIATTDSNGNGVADIAEKGVNAYQGAVRKLGSVAEAISVLT